MTDVIDITDSFSGFSSSNESTDRISDKEKLGKFFVTQTQKVTKGSKQRPKSEGDDGESVAYETEESLATTLLKKTIEVSQLQDLLKQSRISYASRIKKCDEKEQELEVKKREFADHVTKFEKFMSDNEFKRQKALRKMQEEIKDRETMEKDIKTLDEEIDQLQKRKQDIEQQLKFSARYMKYLELVTYEENSYENINELISRYNILRKINAEQIKAAEASENEIEQLKTSTAKYQKEKQTEILVLNSTLIQTKQHMERMQYEKASREHDLFESDRTATEKKRDLSELKLAITNLYGKSRLRNFTKKPVTLLGKLDRICSQIQAYDEILQDYRQSHSHEGPTQRPKLGSAKKVFR